MTPRRRANSLIANPVLVGAVTVLVVVVAVFLAYNANSGLPFVPTTELKVRLANGANLVKGNDVRSGGTRIGLVTEMEAVRLANGDTGAELTLKLDKKVGGIPRDSTVNVRPRSALGLKYLEVTEGTSDEDFRNGDTMAEGETVRPVELDDVLSTFDKPTRDAAGEALTGFGDSLTGRGQDIGLAIERLPSLLAHLTPVARNLADPATDLPTFFNELADFARVVAPVAPQQAHLFTAMADTFEAFSRDEQALSDTLAKAPGTLRVGTDSLRAQRPFLADFAALSVDLNAATDSLRDALPTVNRALKVGTPVQIRAQALNRRLEDTLQALDDLTAAPGTNAALRGLTATVTTLNPQIRFYGPYITVCNSWNYWWTFVAEHFSEEDATGQAQRALLNLAAPAPNGIGAMGATHPANGEASLEPGGTPQYAHNPPYPAAVDSAGNADCEAGQRGYLERQAKYLPRNYKVAIDPRNPGLQGPTYAGRARVPAGQTFVAQPETGPYANLAPSEHP